MNNMKISYDSYSSHRNIQNAPFSKTLPSTTMPGMHFYMEMKASLDIPSSISRKNLKCSYNISKKEISLYLTFDSVNKILAILGTVPGEMRKHVK